MATGIGNRTFLPKPCAFMLNVTADQSFAKLLVERGKLRDADMRRALRVQEGQASREHLSRLIVRLGLISERDAADTLS
jgi:general secretion pathway protein E